MSDFPNETLALVEHNRVREKTESEILREAEILKKEFDNFDVKKVETYDKEKVISLCNNKKIIRHKLKIQSIISNAHYFRKIQKKYGSFSEYIWGFTNWKIKKNNFENLSDLPSKSDLSDKIYIDLKKNGFKFIGSVTIYSFLQAIGIIDNHLKSCYKIKITLFYFTSSL